MLLNFTIRHFYLFLPGVLLSIIGIWFRKGLIIGLALLIVDLIASFAVQLQIRNAALQESDSEEFNQMMDAFYGEEGPDAVDDFLQEKIEEQDNALRERQAILQKLVVYRKLNETIREGMTLDEMVDAFEDMCQIPVGDPDDLLFETGTFQFTGEKLFHFSLVRQFQFMDDDEYVQLRLDVTYTPCLKTKLLYTSKWGGLTEGDFFSAVKNSRSYHIARDLPILQVQVRVEET